MILHYRLTIRNVNLFMPDLVKNSCCTDKNSITIILYTTVILVESLMLLVFIVFGLVFYDVLIVACIVCVCTYCTALLI